MRNVSNVGEFPLTELPDHVEFAVLRLSLWCCDHFFVELFKKQKIGLFWGEWERSQLKWRFPICF